MKKRHISFILLSALVFCALCAPRCAAAPAYRVTVLPPGLGRAVAMNNRGQVLFRNIARSFIWDRGRVTCLQDRGLSGGASAINDLGHVAGESGWIDTWITDVRPPDKHALIWRDNKTIDLGTLVDKPRSVARSWRSSINDLDWVVGTADAPDGPVCPFLWKDGSMVNLRPAGAHAGVAYGVNNRGQIVGMVVWEAYGNDHAFLWEDGQLMDLGTLGGPSSAALAVSGRGEVVGWSDTATARGQAFVWSRGAMKQLPLPKGFTTASANGVNESGTILGTAIRYSLDKENVRNDESRAVIWRNGKVIPLSTLVAATSKWSLTRGVAVNNPGHILCEGKNAKGIRCWLLLTPISPGEGSKR